MNIAELAMRRHRAARRRVADVNETAGIVYAAKQREGKSGV